MASQRSSFREESQLLPLHPQSPTPPFATAPPRNLAAIHVVPSHFRNEDLQFASMHFTCDNQSIPYQMPAANATPDTYSTPAADDFQSQSLPSIPLIWHQSSEFSGPAVHIPSRERPPPLRSHGACQPCRRKHKRCDATRPCFQCKEAGNPGLCIDGLTAFQAGVRKSRPGRPQGGSVSFRKQSIRVKGIDCVAFTFVSGTSQEALRQSRIDIPTNASISSSQPAQFSGASDGSSLSTLPNFSPSSPWTSSVMAHRPPLLSTSSLFGDLTSWQPHPTNPTPSRCVTPPRWPSSDVMASSATRDPLPRPLAGTSLLDAPMLPFLSSVSLSSLASQQKRQLSAAPTLSRSNSSRSSTSTALSGRSLTLIMGSDLRIAKASDPLRILGYHAHDMLLQSLVHYMSAADRPKWSAFANRVLPPKMRSGRPLPASVQDLERIKLRDLAATIPGTGSYTATFPIRKQTGLFISCDVRLSLGSYFGARADEPSTMSAVVVIAMVTARDTLLPKDPFASSLSTSAGLPPLTTLPLMSSMSQMVDQSLFVSNIASTRSSSSRSSAKSPLFAPFGSSTLSASPPLFADSLHSSFLSSDRVTGVSFTSRVRSHRPRRDTLRGDEYPFGRGGDSVPTIYGDLPSPTTWDLPEYRSDPSQYAWRSFPTKRFIA